MPNDRSFPWHRVFHPLCGADPLTLAELMWRRGPPAPGRLPAVAIAAASALARLPFTAVEAALDGLSRDPGIPPVFVVGHPRSGTTHLHNVLAASGAFSTVPPVIAALPWERRTIGPLMRPFIDPRLPRTRLIDGVEMRGDDPTEDEIGLANMGPLSYFHAFYFPSRFAKDYRDGLLHLGPERRRARRDRAIARYVRTMTRGATRPPLLKNPAYTARVDVLARLFRGCRIVHIHRDPAEVFVSARRAHATALREMAMQSTDGVDLDAAVLGTYPEVMAGLRRASADLPRGTFAEIAFDDLIGAPEATLARLWHRLDLPGGAPARAAATAYCARQAGYRRGSHGLPPEDREALRRRWPEDFAAYGRLSAAASG